MATRKKTARRTPKSTGRGSSGRANPRNDGRIISEEQHNEAMRVLRAEYYQAVRSIVEDARQAIKDGEITDRDSLEQWMHETIDGSYWVIYTHANMQVLFVSDNHDAHSDIYGQVPTDGGNINWAAMAFAALEQDVQEQMRAEDVFESVDLNEAPRRTLEASRRHPDYGIRRDYPKIDIYVDREYVATTTWARTIKDAIDQYIAKNPNARNVTAVRQEPRGPRGLRAGGRR